MVNDTRAIAVKGQMSKATQNNMTGKINNLVTTDLNALETGSRYLLLGTSIAFQWEQSVPCNSCDWHSIFHALSDCLKHILSLLHTRLEVCQTILVFQMFLIPVKYIYWYRDNGGYVGYSRLCCQDDT